ncbi:MAG: hypothetical protein COA41_00850 [Sphingopyxis sp.]|nr:MAG: hypothetical protein COA41_00850 [Sphingopyxis sp.]
MAERAAKAALAGVIAALTRGTRRPKYRAPRRADLWRYASISSTIPADDQPGSAHDRRWSPPWATSLK